MRTGKIAQLPHEIRDQLNRRLNDGEQGKGLLKWLNSEPSVQAVLQTQFDGRPISPSNLTEWKNGGHREWQVRQDALSLVAGLRDEAALGDKTLTDQFNQKLAQWVAIHYAASAQALVAAEPDPQVKWSRLRQFCADVSRLRRNDLQAERLDVERERLSLERANTEKDLENHFWEWTKRPEIQEKLHPKQKRGLTPEALAILDGYLLQGISPLDPEEALNAKTWGQFAARPPRGYRPEKASVGAPPAATHSIASEVSSPVNPESISQEPALSTAPGQAPPNGAHASAQPDATEPSLPPAPAEAKPSLQDRTESDAAPTNATRPTSSRFRDPPSRPVADSPAHPLTALPAPPVTHPSKASPARTERCHECQACLPPLLPTGERPSAHCRACGAPLRPPGSVIEYCPKCRACLPELNQHFQMPVPECPLCGKTLPPPSPEILAQLRLKLGSTA